LSKRKTRKFNLKHDRKRLVSAHAGSAKTIEPAELARRERYFEHFVIAALFAFGVYMSVLYFGHTIVPISDFPDFFRVGREVLSLKIPLSFKLAPVLGMLQVGLSYLVGGQHPNLTAGWLINAMLHPFSLILLWLVGREIVGKSAPWVAIVTILNPWVIYMLTEPIVETTLLFFVLLTFYFIFRRSKWCYVFASITTMVRYEGAGLVLAAFVMDMIYGKNRRERLRAFVYSAAASVPLALWMLGTVLTWKSGTTHYFNVLFTKEYAEGFTQPVESRTGLLLHMRLLWELGFRPLLKSVAEARAVFTRPTAAEIQSIQAFFDASKIITTVCFAFGVIWGFVKRKWNILALLIFFVPYFLLHARYPYPLLRYHSTIFWIALLISWFGLQSAWQLIDGNGRVPRPVVLLLQGLAVAIAAIWFVQLIPYLPRISQISPRSVSLPYAAMGLVTLIFAARVYIYKSRYFLRELSVLAALCLIIASNQFVLVRTLGDGQKEKEFKLLADWYVANAKPGEKLAVYMAGVVKIFAPKYADYIVGPPKADNPSDFIKACYENDITYVVWATREGLSTDHTGYRQLNLDKNIALLREPRSIGPYEFIAQVGWEKGWVHIFRLRGPADGAKEKPPGG